MNKQQQEWAERWWVSLPKHHFTSSSKGSKGECFKELDKLNPDEELRDHIDWYTRELTLRTAKMKSAGVKVAPWRHAVRLIRYRFWDDDLPNSEEEKAKAAGPKCRLCDHKAEHASGYCWTHYDDMHPDKSCFSKQDLYNALKGEGLAIENFNSRAEWLEAVKARGAGGPASHSVGRV